MLQMKYGVFGRRLSIYTQSLKKKQQDFKIMEINFCTSKKEHENRTN